jgi:hypothetical protein
MARMIPFPMLPTESSAERILYEGFLAQLDDAYVVFHSVDWVLSGRHGQPEQGEADFVIAHPEDGLLVVEAKGGDLRYDPARRRWSQGGRSGRHELDEDPFHQARDEMHSLVRILEAEADWDMWRPSFGYACAFPHGQYERDAHPAAPASLVIDRDDLDRLAERVREVMAQWRHAGRRFGSHGMQHLEQALGYAVELRTPLALLFREEDRRIVELTQEQAYVRAFVLHQDRAVVTGPPGSGKTLLATSIARHLAEGGRRTLLTCFNKQLAHHLRQVTEGVSHLTVAHFHQLCTDLAREAGLTIPPPPGDHDRAYFDETLPGLLEEAARAAGPRFDAIVVDEAQDFRGWWWPALLGLHRKPDHGTLYLFADESQVLYDGGELPLTVEQRLPALTDNLRNTAAIAEFVSVFFDAKDQAGIAKGPPGRDVEVLAYAGESELLRLVEVVLLNLVDQEGLAPADIAILTPPGREKSLLWAKRRVGRFTLSDAVEPDTILWSTVHAFKGLERPVIVLAELGERHEDDIDRYVRVGASRATHHLIVLATPRVAAAIRRRAKRVAPVG